VVVAALADLELVQACPLPLAPITPSRLAQVEQGRQAILANQTVTIQPLALLRLLAAAQAVLLGLVLVRQAGLAVAHGLAAQVALETHLLRRHHKAMQVEIH